MITVGALGLYADEAYLFLWGILLQPKTPHWYRFSLPRERPPRSSSSLLARKSQHFLSGATLSTLLTSEGGRKWQCLTCNTLPERSSWAMSRYFHVVVASCFETVHEQRLHIFGCHLVQCLWFSFKDEKKNCWQFLFSFRTRLIFLVTKEDRLQVGWWNRSSQLVWRKWFNKTTASTSTSKASKVYAIPVLFGRTPESVSVHGNPPLPSCVQLL